MLRLAAIVLAVVMATSPTYAQVAYYDGGSIYDLDPPSQQSTGNNQLEALISSRQAGNMRKLGSYGPDDLYRRLGRPIGRLSMSVEKPGGKIVIGFCTVSLIADDFILTNSHCIARNVSGTVSDALLTMGYLTPGSALGTKRYGVELKPVEVDFALDDAIHRVRGAPGKEWGTVTLSSGTPRARQSLFIIHHPQGFTQHISLGSCQAGDPPTGDDKLFHICDTMGGSSGAPVFDGETRLVVGLHYRTIDPGILNAGKRIASIAERSELIARLVRERDKAAEPDTGKTDSAELAHLRAEITRLKAERKDKKVAVVTPPRVVPHGDGLAKLERLLDALLEQRMKELLRDVPQQPDAPLDLSGFGTPVEPDEPLDLSGFGTPVDLSEYAKHDVVSDDKKVAAVVTPPRVEPPGGCEDILVKVAAREECLKPGDTFRDCAGCPEMVVVPAGSFMMGSPKNEMGRYVKEGPRHRVTIPAAFAVGKFEVTFDEWDACRRDGGCKHKPSDKGWGRGERPVINVSWDDINQQYLPWLKKKTGQTYRLLTEAEWEYAARAGTTGPFSWKGKISTSKANYNGHYTYDGSAKGKNRMKTMPVESFEPNAYGLYQVHGNVWEWVQDCWNKNYNGAGTDSAARTTGDCSQRVLRGGSYSVNPLLLRSAYRGRYRAGDRFFFFGFRLARTLNP